MSINWQLDAKPAPAILVLPPAAASLDEAHAAIELWEHYSGKTLDDTQRLTVEVMMAVTDAGRWAAKTTGREMARQNGKGDEIEVVELWGLVQRGEAILHTVHDAVMLATQAQQRLLNVLECPDLRRLKKRAWLGTGQQMVEMRNGGIIWYRTRTGGGGRGVDYVDRLVVDEAQHATEEHLAAVSPTMLANPNPQLNAMGTAGLDGKSDWWWTIRKRALSPDAGAFGYVGHTAEQVSIDDQGRITQSEVDAQDRKLWPLANPVLASERGVDVWDFLEEQLLNLGGASFAREHLGVWDPPPDPAGAMAFPPGVWRDLADLSSQAGDPVAFAFDVTPDRASGSIAMAGFRSDGTVHVEVVDNRPGTGWIVGRLAELKTRWKPCAIGGDPAGPAGSLIVPLAEAGVTVEEVAGRQLAQACGGLYDDVMEGRIRHLDQRPLNAAVSAAKRRPLGDAWAWARKDLTDISPLVAVTVARDLLLRHHKPVSSSADFIVI